VRARLVVVAAQLSTWITPPRVRQFHERIIVAGLRFYFLDSPPLGRFWRRNGTGLPRL